MLLHIPVKVILGGLDEFAVVDIVEPFIVVILVKVMRSANDNATIWPRDEIVDARTWIDSQCVRRQGQVWRGLVFGDADMCDDTACWEDGTFIFRQKTKGIGIGCVDYFLCLDAAPGSMDNVAIGCFTRY